MTVGPSKQTCL